MRKFALITGASGFVGRHLCPELVRAGYKIRATQTGEKPPTGFPDEIEWVTIGTIGPNTDWSRALSGGVTHVIHLAAVAHRISSGEKLSDRIYDEVNHLGTAKLAEAVSQTPSMQRLFFMSSIGAVTSLANEPVNEQTTCNPATPYGKSKLAAEKAIRRVLNGSLISWCIFRPPLLYGPGNPGNMDRLLKLIKHRLPLPLASVRNRRTFFYVRNAANAVVTGLEHPECSRKLFCVGDVQDLSTPELLRGLAAASGSKARLFPFPLAGLHLLGIAGTTIRRVVGRSVGIDVSSVEKLCGSLPVDSSAFRSLTGWHPPFSLEQGLVATIGRAIP
jgi:nucleoside-diphosphate-sugar epimerase